MERLVKQARSIAKKRDEIIYVIYESGEYDYATDYDLDTFYYGAHVVAHVEPDGETTWY